MIAVVALVSTVYHPQGGRIRSRSVLCAWHEPAREPFPLEPLVGRFDVLGERLADQEYGRHVDAGLFEQRP
ncbi:hypothetical protein [Streptomyces sp. NPDC059479]|uniref:hypothetical protein n=1 Tax=Streptomyces sp. NPDC059479 TaxID=3346848 RepID=UPI0036ABD67A